MNKISLKGFLEKKHSNILNRSEEFYKYCEEIKKQNLILFKRVSQTGAGPIVKIEDFDGSLKDMYCLASNDYLNLSNDKRVIKAGIEACEKYGSSAGSAPLIGGRLKIHEDLSNRIANFMSCEDAVIFTSGYGMNYGTLTALLGKNDLAVLDTLVHASILDGCSNTNKKYFIHNDMDSLEIILKNSYGKYDNILIAVDGIYSMDGDLAPLDKIYALAKKYGALTYVDEAHATGIIGENGKGAVSHFGLEGKIDFVVGTFSKSFGGIGGFIGASKEICNMLRYFSRHYMFSAAMTPQAAGSIIEAINIIENDDTKRKRLWENIIFFKEGLKEIGFNLSLSDSAIFPLVLGDDEKVIHTTKMLHELGLYVNPVMFPAVPSRKARIRMSLMSEFTIDQLEDCLEKINYVSKKLSLVNKEKAKL